MSVHETFLMRHGLTNILQGRFLYIVTVRVDVCMRRFAQMEGLAPCLEQTTGDIPSAAFVCAASTLV